MPYYYSKGSNQKQFSTVKDVMNDLTEMPSRVRSNYCRGMA
jgi:hypothetical protein